MTAFAKLAGRSPGGRGSSSQSPLVVPNDVLAAGVSSDRRLGSAAAIEVPTSRPCRRPPEPAQQYELIDFARKVVGVGSVGTRCWIVLLLGRDQPRPAVPAGQGGPGVGAGGVAASQSVRQPRTTRRRRPAPDAGIERHPARLAAGPIRRRRARDFYVRQLRDWKGSAPRPKAPPGRAAYGGLCGWTLARAHARSGDRVAIAGYLGKGSQFDRALLEFADRYAEQNDRDYAALADAVATGRLEATTGL